MSLKDKTFEKLYEKSKSFLGEQCACQKMPRNKRNQQNRQKVNEDASKCRKISDFFSQRR